ncbi:type VI secretion system baseplate subunit TssG [Pseudoduganella sp. FT93W]|uniref:Type VI secretion system baseplate subunit TssG n=1 Tax=Duganella fentianensis TaxID=2692177 RepID=A0A845I273_9BURK|nr:type VI secretion system baseplate subunit TssG [Duganella fentianensis]MYN46207.1 type VI secretion system baseplate subunit TssG [Duganella fentianensis]
MQATKRLSNFGLIQSLINEPQRFQFVQALRILLRWMRRHGISHELAFAEILRFQNSLSLKFPASELAAIPVLRMAAKADAELLGMLQSRNGTHLTLTPTFFGLLGVNGTLPLHKTESIAAARRWGGDAVPHAFIDLLSQRLTALFFHACGKYRLEHTLDVQGLDGQLPLLLSLSGLHSGVAKAVPRPADHVAAYYTALIRTRPISSSTISRMLTQHFGVPIELEQFVEAWDTIPHHQRSKLGSKVSRLGYGTALGGRLIRQDLCARLHIGPLGLSEFEQFLPGRAAAVALGGLLQLFYLPNLKFQLRLLLHPSCVQALALNSRGHVGPRLGWDAFLLGRSGNVSRSFIDYWLPDSGDVIA